MKVMCPECGPLPIDDSTHCGFCGKESVPLVETPATQIHPARDCLVACCSDIASLALGKKVLVAGNLVDISDGITIINDGGLGLGPSTAKARCRLEEEIDFLVNNPLHIVGVVAEEDGERLLSPAQIAPFVKFGGNDAARAYSCYIQDPDTAFVIMGKRVFEQFVDLASRDLNLTLDTFVDALVVSGLFTNRRAHAYYVFPRSTSQ